MNEKGLSLIELLVSLGIVGIALSLSTPSVLQMMVYFTKARTIFDVEQREEHAETFTKQLLNQTRLISAIGKVRVHKSNRILNVKGKDISPTGTSKNTIPDKQSLALSILSPAPSALKRHDNAFCLEAGDAPDLNTEKLYIALGYHTPYEVMLTLKKHSNLSTTCKHLYTIASERLSDEMFYESERNLKKSTVLLIPVIHACTLYISQSKSLRYLSHTSVENQPVVHGIETFRVETQASNNKSELLVGTFLAHQDSKGRSFFFALKKSHPYSYDLFL